MTEEKKVAWAKEQLLSKMRELGRLPKKEDFDDATRSRIKAFLGPWPRALERAGLKKVHDPKPRTYYSPNNRRLKLKRTRKQNQDEEE